MDELSLLWEALDDFEKTLGNLKTCAKDIGFGDYHEYVVSSVRKEQFPTIYGSVNGAIEVYKQLCEQGPGFDMGALIVEFEGEVYCVIKRLDEESVSISDPLTLLEFKVEFPEEYQRMVCPNPEGYA